ncbi:PilZ domain-containing protein [Magnetospirillum sp. SS-4]|uniref:PilZ domain-containing protein n=1 Tax=Magnetospirillum sp. SS-4 TaxID=2681465 RepID=UPI001573DCDC|nr:PilZ domain-containing protein [Magnetospirillum sp. SS-4]
MTQAFTDQGSRSWQRHNCGNDGTILIGDAQSRAFMIDASRGGFKLRFEQVESAMAALSPLPRDINVVNNANSTFAASAIWAKDGLAGCRFYQHLSLDEVVSLMTGRFKIQLARINTPS